MPEIQLDGRTYILSAGQSVLDGLLEQGVPVPHACRAGVCQACLMRAEAGAPPEAAQHGLKPTLKASRHFLACLCKPETDLTVALPKSGGARLRATVVGMELLNAEIMQVSFEAHERLDYRAGQFIDLFPDETLGRSYSLVSVPAEDRHLQIHVRRFPQGQVSGWVHDTLRPGQIVAIQGPRGDCFYLPDRPEQGLLLIGTGIGLAPLYGILRDALGQGHRGPIHLFHGSRQPNGLYLVDELRALARSFPNFTYTPCLSGDTAPSGHAAGRAHEVALRELPRLDAWRVFLCGHPDMVKSARKQAFLAGAAMKDIYCDPFMPTPATIN